MSTPWTTERVLGLAPDASSLAAGKALASLAKWSSIGQSGRAIWGLCQGSGNDPYQTRVDLAEPAFKCSCPSRKFPCKHGLGLMLCFAKNPEAFITGAEPGWVAEWIASRADRAEKKTERAAAIENRALDKPVDEEAQTARAARRESRMRDGVAQCRLCIDDLLRRGLAAAQSEPRSFWEQTAARMVDAQAPGLATALRTLADALSSGEGWHRRTLDHIGRLHLLLTAAERIEALPPDLATDTRVGLGVTQSKADALALPDSAITDHWIVAGQIMEEEDGLRIRRTWLFGRASGRRALIVDFAAGQQPIDTSIVAGTEFEGDVVFFPSCLPLRALVKSRSSATRAISADPMVCGDATCEAALRSYAEAMARLPWITRWPILLASVTPGLRGDAHEIIDRHGACLPLRRNFPEPWKLVSVSGGAPVDVMGEWDGEELLPLSIMPSATQRSFEDLAPRWVA